MDDEKNTLNQADLQNQTSEKPSEHSRDEKTQHAETPERTEKTENLQPIARDSADTAKKETGSLKSEEVKAEESETAEKPSEPTETAEKPSEPAKTAEKPSEPAKTAEKSSEKAAITEKTAGNTGSAENGETAGNTDSAGNMDSAGNTDSAENTASEKKADGTEDASKTTSVQNPSDGQPTEEPAKKKSVGKTIAKIFGGIAAAAVVACAGYYGYGVWYYGTHFYNGTTLTLSTPDGAEEIRTEDISGMSLKNAQALAESYADGYTLSVTNSDKGTTDTVSGEAIDYHIDITNLEQTVNAQDNWLWVTHMTDFAQAAAEQNATVVPVYDADKLSALYDGMECINPAQEDEGSDAYLSYNDEAHLYEIVPEVPGNMGDQEQIAKDVEAALAGMADTLELTNKDYHLPEVTSEDEFLNSKMNELNTYLSAKITLKDGDKTLVVDGSVIENFLDIDEDWNVTLDQDKITSYINKTYDPLFDTGGTNRTITTPGSGTFTVYGGTLKKTVKTSAELEVLVEEITNGETTERKPEYYATYECDTNGGIGDTYIDVNITTQTVYVVKDGSIAFTTACVTGTDNEERRTPTGVYYVVRKVTNYTMVKYQSFVYYWMPIDDSTGVGLHDATWRSSFGGTIYKYSGSHGCINLPKSAAATIYNMVDTGIPVVVHY